MTHASPAPRPPDSREALRQQVLAKMAARRSQHWSGAEALLRRYEAALAAPVCSCDRTHHVHPPHLTGPICPGVPIGAWVLDPHSATPNAAWAFGQHETAARS